jgi:microcystin-dependent protein
MAGTIPLSMTQQFDVYGQPLSGGQLYIIQAGTVSTPQDAFADTGLTIKMPYPMTLDAAGRIPQFFLADGTVKIRLQDKAGVVQLAADNVLVIGPSAGGGGGGATIDPTTIWQTGDLKPRYSIGAHAGWVRANGNTIGSATSGATERANADAQNLFLLLWGVDPNLTVSSGRGASAAADWTANKTITVPNWSGLAISGMEGMGGTGPVHLSVGFFGTDPTNLGAAGGAESTTLTTAQMPSHAHSGTTTTESATHTHGYTDASVPGGQKPSGTGTSPFAGVQSGTTGGQSVPHTHDFNTTSVGGGTAHRTMGPRRLCTIYIKL